MADPPELPAVAVVGLGCRFPGARDLAEYWENLHTGRCAITDFARDELAAAGVDQAELDHPRYVPAKGYLADADRFEAELFGFTAGETAALDPQHRLLLETAWAALEDAGYDPRRAPERTGVYVGGGLSEHMLAAHSDRALATALGSMQVRILTDRDFLAPWISYRMSLTGPSITVQTACSTSLTAIHLAAQALLLGECDLALAGGVAVDSVRKHGYLHYQGGILSPDGRCRPFDEKAAGTVPGNGAGVVVLRRLADALADGDPVRAVIRGTALTNDGATKLGFTAPGVDQQTAAIVEAWSAAGLTPSDAQYLEAHGTGTALGDQVELAAIRAAWGTAGNAGSCGIGSVKSNLGHLDAAAGVAAFIKTVLMLEHRTLAPTVNVTRPHPDLALPGSPCRLVDRLTAWPRPDGPRLAGVTSLGIGGTNVHVVLSEAPKQERRDGGSGTPGDFRADGTVRLNAARSGLAIDGQDSGDPGPDSQHELLPLSARTPPQLATAARRLASVLRGPDPPSLRDVAHTLRTGRTPFPVRACVSASDPQEAAAKLEVVAAQQETATQQEMAAHQEAVAGRPGAVMKWPGVVTGVADDLPPLAQAWVRGEEVALPAPTDGGRRVHLPTFPFAGTCYGALRPAGSWSGRAAASATAATLATAPADPAIATATDLAPSTFAPDGSGDAAAVAALLRGALGLDEPDQLDLTYLAAGGDSLTAVHLVGRLRDDFAIDVPIELFLEQLTLRELVDRIVATRAGEDTLASLIDEFEAEH